MIHSLRYILLTHSGNGIVAHKPICPDKPEPVSGFGQATHNGFWVGMMRKDQIINKYTDIQGFLDALGNQLNLQRNSSCTRCGV
jgi:hypothetical protein